MILFLVAFMAFACLAFPEYSWDFRAFWLLHGKILRKYKTWQNPEHLDPARYFPAYDYPPLAPLAYAITGPRRWFGLAGYILLLWLMWDWTHNMGAVWLAGTIPAYWVVYSGSFPSGYVDPVLGVFYFGAVTCLLRGDQLGGSLWLTLCVLLKNEGLVLYVLALPLYFL